MFKFCKTFWKMKPSRQLFGKRNLYVLGIESSCDDTGAAVVDDTGRVLGENLFSQAPIHIETGGIQPNLAKKFHESYIKDVVDVSMKQSGLDFKDLNAIAVTVKPGLILSLMTGFNYAKCLCDLHKKPMIPIHHMQAHALTARMLEEINFPFLVFLISGGHCLLAVAKDVENFSILGETLDCTPGQILDKVSRRAKLKSMKQLKGLVGGAAIETLARNGDPKSISFPSQIALDKNCNFSFSGIGSFASHYIETQENLLGLEPSEVIPNINDFCASFQWSLTRHLCKRLEIAIKYLDMNDTLKEKCLVVSGGVASNNFIRKALKFVCDYYSYRMVVPPSKLCTDNGVMIAWNGIEKLKLNVNCTEVNNVVPEARCPIGKNESSLVSAAMKNDISDTIRLTKFLKEENQMTH